MFTKRFTTASGQITRALAICLLLIGTILLSLSVSNAGNRQKVNRNRGSVTTAAAQAASVSPPQCTLPGVQVLSDPAGDQTGGSLANQQFDLTAAYVAEPFTSSSDHSITFTIKVSTLSPAPPPNATWQLNMVTTDTNGTPHTIFFDMNTASTGATASFDYGYHDPSQNIDLSQCGIPVPLISSCPVTGSNNPDGTITIKVDTSQPLQYFDATGNPAFTVDLLAPGKSLTNMNAVATMLVGGGGSGAVVTVDQMTAGSGSYLTIGNAACNAAITPTPTPVGTPTPTPTATPTATPTPPAGGTPAPGTPRFFIYMSPNGVGDSAGEPSIGSNWTKEAINHNHNVDGSTNNIPNGGTSLYYGGFLPDMLKLTWDDCSSPAGVTWDQKPLVSASTPRAAGDPILFTDHITGRTFCAQLEGLTPAGATIDITDDDGDTFTPSDGVVPSDVDHETLGGGIYHAPLTGGVDPLYPNAVYYASQSITDARCLRSDTGGLVFSQAATPMFTAADCAGLHGHVKVSPADGTVYVPDFACGGNLPFHDGGKQAVAVSEDNGITWSVRTIPDSTTSGVVQEPVVPGTAQTRDPSVAIATDGTVYFAYQAANGHCMVAVSHDKGVTWAPSVDVGASVLNGGPVLNATFEAAVAGDPNRAAVAFVGTETGGNNWDCGNGNTCDYGPDFTGVWYLYIAASYDGGQTWITQNVTPGDPIQRGGICGGGTCRNLLDFMGATVDKEGRILVGYDDGCVTASCIAGGPNDYTAKAAIARQSGGMRMFAAYDPAEPLVPGAPLVTGTSSGNTATLSWPIPDNGGSAITSYNIYRKHGAGSFALLGSVTVPAFTDPNFAAGDVYHVTAVNSKGEGAYCPDVAPAGAITPPDPCTLPGVLAVVDNDGDAAPNLPPDPRVDVQQLFVAEPLFSPAAEKLVFTLQMAPSTAGSAPASSQWYIVWNRQGTDPSDPNDTSYDRMYVAMKSDVNGAVTFDYGKFGIPLNEVPPPPPDPNANTPKSYGAPDNGSYDPTTGIIRITISNDKLRGIDGGANSYKAGSGLSALNVRTYLARPDAGQKSQNNANDITPNGSYSLAGNASCATNSVPILSVVSAKIHGTAGEFDIPLPYTGNTSAAGIECRTGGTNGAYTVVFSFVNPLVSVASVNVSGSATIDTNNSGINTSNPHEYIVKLTGVADQQHVVITLNGVLDSANNSMASLSATMGVLIGDVNASGRTDNGDAIVVRNKSGTVPSDLATARADVNCSGRVDNGDAIVIRNNSGKALPP